MGFGIDKRFTPSGAIVVPEHGLSCPAAILPTCTVEQRGLRWHRPFLPQGEQECLCYLFVAEGDEWVDVHGAAGWDVACGDCYCGQEEDAEQQSCRVERL